MTSEDFCIAVNVINRQHCFSLWNVPHVLFSLYNFENDKYQTWWKNQQNCYLSETKRWNKKNGE